MVVLTAVYWAVICDCIWSGLVWNHSHSSCNSSLDLLLKMEQPFNHFLFCQFFFSFHSNLPFFLPFNTILSSLCSPFSLSLHCSFSSVSAAYSLSPLSTLRSCTHWQTERPWQQLRHRAQWQPVTQHPHRCGDKWLSELFTYWDTRRIFGSLRYLSGVIDPHQVYDCLVIIELLTSSWKQAQSDLFFAAKFGLKIFALNYIS